ALGRTRPGVEALGGQPVQPHLLARRGQLAGRQLPVPRRAAPGPAQRHDRFVAMNPIEILAAVLSALGVWLMARRRPWAWPIGLVSVLIYAWVFIEVRLYSDALLQGAFAAMLVYGWSRWLRNLGEDGRVRIAPLPLP